jgi:hypothetical protein
MLQPPYVYLGPDSLTRNFDDPRLDGFLCTTPGINTTTPQYNQMVNQWNSVYAQDPTLLFNRTSVDLEQYAAYGFDSVFVAAGAIHRYNVLKDVCNYSLPYPSEFAQWFPPEFGEPCEVANTTTDRKLLYLIMRYVQFDGVSGGVEFDENSERLHANWDILNRQHNNWVKVGTGTTGKVTLFAEYPILWPGGTTVVPLDHIPPKKYSALLSSNAQIGYLFFSGLLIVIILLLLLIVVLLRDSRAMKSASPKLLLVVLLGSLGISIVAVLHCLEPSPALCGAKLWLFHLGLTAAVGALLVTLYRLYRVFNNDKLESLDYLRDKYLLQYLCVLLLIESVILIGWIAYRPFIVDDLGRCSSNAVTEVFPLLAFTKALYIALAGALSYFTRTVPARFHHSVSVSLCVYNLAVVSLTWILVANFLGNAPQDANFKTQFEICCLLISQFNLISLLFGPKIYALVGNNELSCGGIAHEMRRRATRQGADMVEQQSAGLEVDTIQRALNRGKNELADAVHQLALLQSEVNERREHVFLIEDEVRFLRKTNKRRSSFFFALEQVTYRRRTMAAQEMAVHQGSTSNLHSRIQSSTDPREKEGSLTMT